ncbi:MAG: hypothetical protein KAR40_15445 [Candidatus Sabulitectum sp.]|nr:hypothetical protein [Candidatus Sabulitectum sp.]
MKIYTDGGDFTQGFKRYVRETFKSQGGDINAGHNTLLLISDMLEGHGVEFLRSSYGSLGNFAEDGIEYVNMGDTYALTVIFDVASRRFYWCDLGSLVERQHKRFSN